MSNPPGIHTAVILAAGRGTRLASVEGDIPKALVTVGDRPVIVRILDGLIREAIKDIVVVTGYRAEEIQRELGNGTGSGIQIAYVHQEVLDGTAHALSLARELLGAGRFFFTWTDIVVGPVNYRAVLRAARFADAAIAVNPVDDPSSGAAVFTEPPLPWPPAAEIPPALVTSIVEKPPPGVPTSHWNNAGFGVLGPQIWPAIDTLAPSSRGEYELPSAIDAIVHEGARIRAVPVVGPCFDIGTPESLAAARVAFTS